MLKKGNDEEKTIYELNKAELAKYDIDFSHTPYGKRLNSLSMWTGIITAFTVIYAITIQIANGYIDLSNIVIILMIGFGLVAIARIMYYQSLAKYFQVMNKK